MKRFWEGVGGERKGGNSLIIGVYYNKNNITTKIFYFGNKLTHLIRSLKYLIDR